MRPWLLLFVGLVLLVAFAESQSRRNSRRFPLRGRQRQSIQNEEIETGKESPLIDEETVLEPIEPLEEVPKPRRPTRRRRPGRRRGPLRGRERPEVKEAEVEEKEMILALLEEETPKPSPRRGLRVRIPKRNKPAVEEITPELISDRETKDTMVKEMKDKPAIKHPKILPLPFLKPQKQDKKEVMNLEAEKKEQMEIEIDEPVKTVPKPPVKFRPLPIKLSSRGKPKKEENEKKIEMEKELETPKEESTHRFAGRFRSPLRSRGQRVRDQKPKTSPEEVVVEDVIEEAPEAVQQRVPPRRRIRPNRPRFNQRSRQREQSAAEDTLPTAEEVQEENAVQALREEPKTMEDTPAAEQTPSRLPNIFDFEDEIQLEEPTTTTFEVPTELTTLKPTFIPEEEDEESRFATIHKIPDEIEGTTQNKDEFLDILTEQSPIVQDYQDNLHDYDLFYEYEDDTNNDTNIELLPETENVAPDTEFKQDQPITPSPKITIKTPDDGQIEAPQATPKKSTGRIRISRKQNKINQKTTTTTTPTPILAPEDPDDRMLPSKFPKRRYGRPDISFNGGQVVITEIGTREDTPEHQVRVILSGLGSRRRGLARPSEKKAAIVPQRENKFKVPDLEQEYDYQYDYNYDTI